MASFMRSLPLSMRISAVVFVACMVISKLTFTYSNSSAPAGYTGAPSDRSCTSCHSGTVIKSGTPYNSVRLSMGQAKLEYVPGTKYTMTLSYADNNQNKYGFQAVALRSSNSTNAGDITITNNTTTAKRTKTVSGSVRQYVSHAKGGVIGNKGKISWSFEWKAPAKSVGNIKFYVTVMSADRNGQSSGDKTIERVFELKANNGLPVASIKASPTSACQGDVVQFTGSGTNKPTKYSWVFPDGTPNKSTAKSVKVVFNSPGTKTVKLVATNAKGKSPEKRMNYVVKNVPSNLVDSSGSLTFCDGGSVTLTAKGGSAWEWSNGEKTASITVKNTANLKVKTFASNGCFSESSDFSIVKHPLLKPTLKNLNNQNICQDDSVRLLSDANLDSFELFNNGTKLTGHTNPRLAFISLPGNHYYTVFGTDQYGCQSDSSLPVRAKVDERMKAPTISCDSATADNLIIGWDAINGAKAYELSTDDGKSWFSPSFTDGSNRHEIAGLTFSTEVDFQIRAHDPGPCEFSEVGKATCKTKSCFKVRYQLAVNDTLCDGDSLKIQISNLNLSKFSLAFDNGLYDDKLSYATVPIKSKELKISFVDSFSLSCKPEDTLLDILVSDLPIPIVEHKWPKVANDENRICETNAAFSLQGATSDHNGPYRNWNWSGAGVIDNRDNTYDFDPSITSGKQVLTYSVENAHGCKGRVSEKVSIDKSVIESDFTYNYPGTDGNVSFEAIEKNATDRIWDFGDGTSDIGKTVVHGYDLRGVYTVKLTSSNGNSACLAITTKEVDVIVGSVDEPEMSFDLFPNPATYKLELRLHTSAAYPAQIRVLDIMGKVVLEKRDVAAQTTLNVEALKPGTYLIQVSTADFRGQRVFMKR